MNVVVTKSYEESCAYVAQEMVALVKSMVTLLTSAFACGDRIEICGEGEDEVEAVEALIALIDNISE